LMTRIADALAGEAGAGRLKQYLRQWRMRTLSYDGLCLLPIIIACGAAFVWAHDATMSVVGRVFGNTFSGWIIVAVVVILLGLIHFGNRRLAARLIARRIEPASRQAFGMDLRRAFESNVRSWRSIFRFNPKGWHLLARRRVARIRRRQEGMIRRLNDRFTQPSG